MKTIGLYYDDSPECPNEWGGWKLYSFSRRHNSYESPERFFPNGKPTLGLRRKLAVGTAFILSYFEHGQCRWSRRGTGPQCQFDNVDVAGILVWEAPVKNLGAKTLADRQKDADGFLETYTNWCNGSVYGFRVTDHVKQECGHVEKVDLDSCFGFYDLDSMAEEIRQCLNGDTEIQFEGDAKDLGSFLKLDPPVIPAS